MWKIQMTLSYNYPKSYYLALKSRWWNYWWKLIIFVATRGPTMISCYTSIQRAPCCYDLVRNIVGKARPRDHFCDYAICHFTIANHKSSSRGPHLRVRRCAIYSAIKAIQAREVNLEVNSEVKSSRSKSKIIP